MVLDLIESSRIEFKVKMVDNLEETIIAFLNSKDGGIIYLGINDKGKIIGLNGNLDLLQRKVKDRIISNIEPSALGLFDLEILEKDNKKYLKIIGYKLKIIFLCKVGYKRYRHFFISCSVFKSALESRNW